MKNEKISIPDEMISIMRSIWSSRTKEQMDGCEKMLITFTKTHKNNLGTTLIKIEMARQYRMCGLWAKMGQVQEALNKENEEKKLDKDKNNLSLN
jgi:hypothetical protein|tara:strand:+ start:898 stop:1182 length:285 start_codon:yes stop_codon:yes gene_type:complete